MSLFPMRFRALAAGSVVCVLCFSALFLAGCGGEETQETDAGFVLGAPVEDSTIAAIAEVNSFTDTLTYERLQREMNQLTRGQLPMLPDSVQQQVQQVSVMRFLTTASQIAEARERGIEVDSAAVNQQLQRLRMSVGSDSLFQARLAQSGMSLADLRENIREQLLVRNLQETLAEEVEDPSASEVEEYRTDQAREVRVQQILFSIPPGASEAQRDSVKRRAQAVLDSIQSGAADFSTMVQRYGQGGGDEQGSLGYQTREQMAGPFARRGQQPAEVPFVEAAFALQDSGAVAEEPVRTRYGYHIIRQTGARTGELMDSTRAAQQFTMQRRQEAVTEAVEDLRENVTLRINPERVTADMTEVLEEGEGEEQSENS